MTTDAFWYACLFAGKNFAMQLWEQKLLQILHHFWTPKWGLKNGPKNGARIWPPKWGPKMAPKRVAQYFISCRSFWNQNIWPLFGCHFWTPFWGSNSGTIFGSIFQPPFWGPKMVQNLQKFLLSKLHSKFFSSKQTRISKCICSHFLASCISEHNAILHLVKPSKITTSFDCHKCCTWAGWIRASESDTVEVLSCETDFLHETWPRFGGRQSWPFCQIGSLKGLHQRCNWFMHFWRAQGPSLGFFTRFSFRFGLHFHVSFVLDCSKKCLAGVAVWRSVLLRPCLSNLFLGRWLP